jgi:hypothetical protein
MHLLYDKPQPGCLGQALEPAQAERAAAEQQEHGQGAEQRGQLDALFHQPHLGAEVGVDARQVIGLPRVADGPGVDAAALVPGSPPASK